MTPQAEAPAGCVGRKPLWIRTRPPYLVLLGVAGVREVDDGGEVMYVPAAQAAPEETLRQQGAHVGLPGARPAVQGQDQWFAGGRVPYKGLQ